jgi:ParB family chromosome partitioning protein
MKIPINRILANPQQPRQVFDHQALQELADSIKENGLLHPILVEDAGDHYILIDGERRLRAHRLAGLVDIEANVRPGLNGTGKEERRILALVANVQRVDLNPIEEGRTYIELKGSGWSNAKIAHRAGKSTTHIANRINLANLDPEIQDLIAANALPADDHAVKALLSIQDTDARIQLARRISGPQATVNAVVKSVARFQILSQAAQQPPVALQIPSVDLAIARRHARPDISKWDVLSQLGQLPPWRTVEAVALTTCNACSIRDDASEASCKECPAVDLIRRLMDAAAGGAK